MLGCSIERCKAAMTEPRVRLCRSGPHNRCASACADKAKDDDARASRHVDQGHGLQGEGDGGTNTGCAQGASGSSLAFACHVPLSATPAPRARARAHTHTHTHTRTHTASILHSGSHSRQYHCAAPHRAVSHQAQAKHKVTAEIVDGEERRIRVVVPLGKGKLGINVSEEDGPSFITKVGGATPSCLSGGATLLRVSWATPLHFVGRRVVPQLCESRGPHSSLLLYYSAHPFSVLHICPICL
jgi:hypothetical protein